MTGTEELPYDLILGYAGYRLAGTARRTPLLGLTAVRQPDGSLQVTAVSAGSAVAEFRYAIESLDSPTMTQLSVRRSWLR